MIYNVRVSVFRKLFGSIWSWGRGARHCPATTTTSLLGRRRVEIEVERLTGVGGGSLLSARFRGGGASHGAGAELRSEPRARPVQCCSARPFGGRGSSVGGRFHPAPPEDAVRSPVSASHSCCQRPDRGDDESLFFLLLTIIDPVHCGEIIQWSFWVPFSEV